MRHIFCQRESFAQATWPCICIFPNIQLPRAAHLVVFLSANHKTPHSVTLPLTSHGIKVEYSIQLRCWLLFKWQKRWNINTKAWLNRMHDAFSGTMIRSAQMENCHSRGRWNVHEMSTSWIPTTAETTSTQNTDHENVQHENRVRFDTTKRIVWSINLPWILEETSVLSRKCSVVREHLKLMKLNL